jgi:hypothetical protein
MDGTLWLSLFAHFLLCGQYGISAHFEASSEIRTQTGWAKPLILRQPNGQQVRLSRNTDMQLSMFRK